VAAGRPPRPAHRRRPRPLRPAVAAFERYLITSSLTGPAPTSRDRGVPGHQAEVPEIQAGEQRRLFRRWSINTWVDLHEAVVGLHALLHGASPDELRHPTIEINMDAERQLTTEPAQPVGR
jgi:hypothetical protein